MEKNFSELAKALLAMQQALLGKALLAMQQALLGSVVPSLRAITVDIDVEDKILFYSFFYDGTVTDNLFDLASVASAEASANFPEYQIEEKIERLDYPEKIPVQGRYAYLRKE